MTSRPSSHDGISFILRCRDRSRRTVTFLFRLSLYDLAVPQFELKDVDGTELGRLRARYPEEAVREWLDLPDHAEVFLDEPSTAMDALEGWKVIRVGGSDRGWIRSYQRMRFRRD